MVKQYLVAIAILFMTLPTHAQERTLLGEDIENGGFGGPVIKVTPVNGETKVMTGVRGGWIINHFMVIGVGSYTMVNEFDVDGQDYDLDYSGLELEYIVRPLDLIHYSAFILIGRGDIRHKEDQPSLSDFLRTDGVFVLEPVVNVEANVTKHFHVGAGLGYRLVTGVDVSGLSNTDIGGVTATLSLKFGKF